MTVNLALNVAPKLALKDIPELVSTNNFRNETDLRLQLYNPPENASIIAFCYIIESHSVSNLVRLR